jgi:hypothetical protein
MADVVVYVNLDDEGINAKVEGDYCAPGTKVAK